MLSNPENAISMATIRTVFTSSFAYGLTRDEDPHENALRFVGQMLGHGVGEGEIEDLVRSLLPENYSGNTLEEVPGMIVDGIKKGYDKPKTRAVKSYEMGDVGPKALGFTKEGNYALLDRERNIVLFYTSNQLLSQYCLVGLAPASFWRRQFPPLHKNSPFESFEAGESLIAACRAEGPFNPLRIRGRGIWLEDGSVVVNLGATPPVSSKHMYLCFEPIPLPAEATFNAVRLLNVLEKFRWRHALDAKLFLGWLAIAPICGALEWRPHIFIYGPARCGKTTLHGLAAKILDPLAISADGQSSEAGLRQELGPDSRPIILDEFENDQGAKALKAIIRLARSASSAENAVYRGTPDGKAMRFSLRTTFMFGAINPRGMSAADESRILLLELLMHANDREAAKLILEETAYLKDKGPQWCAYMASHAAKIPDAVTLLEPRLPSADRRHRQNIASLLAGYFVALNGRIPSSDEADSLAIEFSELTKVHGESLDRNDAEECFDYLLSHQVESNTLGFWLALAYRSEQHDNHPLVGAALRIARMFGVALRPSGDEPGIIIRNRSPLVEKAYSNTTWEGDAWPKALKKLDGAFSPEHPVWFPGWSSKQRGTFIPARFVPEVPDEGETYDMDHRV